MAEATARWRKRHPERQKDVRRKSYWNRKRKALNMLGGPVCDECWCREIEFLEVNHIGGGWAKDIRENGNRTIDRLLTGDLNPDDFNVLCRVCNAVDFLKRKKPDASGRFHIYWEDYTGNKAKLMDGLF